jgi:hypothetical protein
MILMAAEKWDVGTQSAQNEFDKVFANGFEQ